MIPTPVVKSIVVVAVVYAVTFLVPLALGRKRVGIVAPVAGVVGVAFHLLVNRSERFRALGFRLAAPADYGLAFLSVGTVLLAVLVAGWATRRLRLREEADARTFARLAVNVLLQTVQNGVVAVVTEELVFRGLVQRQLSQALPPVAAILIAAAAFGLWHAPLGWLSLDLNRRQVLLYALGTGLAGALFGVFYHRSQSLLVSGFAHGAWNGIVYPVWGLGDAFPSLLASDRETLTHPEYGVIGVVVLTAATALLLVLRV